MSTISDSYRRLSQAFADRIAEVPDGVWDKPSTCSEWTTLDLVRHVVETPDLFMKLVGRELGPVPPVEDDPAAAFDASRRAVQADLDDPGLAATGFDGFFGPTTFELAIDRFVTFDLVVHGWDLARSAGLDERLDPDDVRRVLDGIEGFGDTLRGAGICGPPVAVPANADDQTRMLGLLGRHP